MATYVAQIKQLALLGDDGEPGAAAEHQVGRLTGDHLGQQLDVHIVGLGYIGDLNIGMIGVEDGHHLVDHRRKPRGCPVLVDQFHGFPRGGRFLTRRRRFRSCGRG